MTARHKVVEGIQFDLPNVRQTAIHLIRTESCSNVFSEETLKEHLIEEAQKVVKSESFSTAKLINIPATKAYIVVEDLRHMKVIATNPHKFEISFFVRLGHRDEA
ncbi:hypothetical protein [Vibrio sp. D431a]|uniref:hypothetical protein n=1 Tax=Vibrio sp. D431a TaxID=2837388 RepID=UPI0025550766|nr:hypothetical protein [Vibrio sp. D431a]MDK9789945.1 hypothetical protein [Vibrio sp. D431a]